MSLDGLNITAFLESAAKGGPPAIIIAFFYGLAKLVREVKSVQATTEENDTLTRRVEILERKQQYYEGRDRWAREVMETFRAQRNDDRSHIRFLEQIYKHEPKSDWPPDPPLAYPVFVDDNNQKEEDK